MIKFFYTEWLLNQSERALYDQKPIWYGYSTNQSMRYMIKIFYLMATQPIRVHVIWSKFDTEWLLNQSDRVIKFITKKFYTEWILNQSERALYDQNFILDGYSTN